MNFQQKIIYFLRILLVLVTVYLIYKQDFLFAFASLIALIIAFTPALIEKNYKVSLPWLVEFLILLTLVLHIIGSLLDWFSSIGFFSSLMHFLGTTTVALLAFIIVYTLNLTKKVRLSPLFIGIFTVVFALAVGAVWEIGEFACDQTLGTNFQRDYGLDPIVDTMYDLIWDFIAALFVAILGTCTHIIQKDNMINPFKKLISKIFKKPGKKKNGKKK